MMNQPPNPKPVKSASPGKSANGTLAKPAIANDLPEHARKRLKMMQQGGAQQNLFTSDLSVNEFLLVKEAGFEPLGLVMGCSMYHIGFQWAGVNQNMEMDVLTQAMYHARKLAMSRMEEEAEALEAEGIIGVNIQEHQYSWSSHVLEFFTLGTAVVATRSDHQIPTPHLTLSLNDPAPVRTRIMAPPTSH